MVKFDFLSQCGGAVLTFNIRRLQRLGNLATNRSNVYAVWITLGKFEVADVPITRRSILREPALVSELGSSTGQIEQKRAFYLIDRSIPVGFSRGHKMNAERTVLGGRVLDD